MSLVETFLQHAGPARAALAQEANLETILRSLVDLGRAAWPALTVAPEAFAHCLAEKLPGGEDALPALQQMYIADLYLAHACAQRDPVALQIFEDQFLAPSCAFLGADAVRRGLTEDVKQTLRTRLLVGDAAEPPKIASYQGQGPLAGWLRSVASRVAVDLRRAHKRTGDLSNAYAEVQPPRPDPELDFLKKHYQGDLEEALRETLAALPRREANVLRLHFLEGMTMGSIAGLYRVSWRTVQRWVASARQHVFNETRRILAKRLEVSSSQIDTLLRFAEADLNISLHRFLKDEKP